MLRAGEVDAIIAGGGLSKEPGIRPLIPSPAEAALAWNARTGVVPINHMVAIRREIAESEPDVVREVFRMLGESRAAAGEQHHGDGPDLQPAGFANVRAALETGIRYAFEQDLIKKKYTVEELYGDVLAAL